MSCENHADFIHHWVSLDGEVDGGVAAPLTREDLLEGLRILREQSARVPPVLVPREDLEACREERERLGEAEWGRRNLS